MTRMVIIGAGMAGARAVIGLRGADYQGDISLIGEEAHLPYDRPPLSKAAITEETTPTPVWLLDEDITKSLKADVRTNVKAEAIDREEKRVRLSDGSSLAYEKLLIATGAKPRALKLLGGEHALLLRNFEDALLLREKFQPDKKIVVIGGGFIGLELASSARKRGCEVTVIEAQPRILMRGVTEAVAKIVHDEHVAQGVTMLCGTGLKAIEKDAVHLLVHLNDGRVIPTDTIIAGIGAAPDVTLAEAAGLAIDNGIACNAELQTSDVDIYAAGDCCSFIHHKFGNRRIRLEAWRNAQDQGMIAAENMVGRSRKAEGIPWFWSDQYDLSLQVTGFADMGKTRIERRTSENTVVEFFLSEDGTLMGASGIGVGNSIGRDIKLAEMLIAKGAKPDPASLADTGFQLKAMLRG
jgi:3-phenylpropionate/trans-cinnamate dioxygenase ferredoxin reductase component